MTDLISILEIVMKIELQSTTFKKIAALWQSVYERGHASAFLLGWRSVFSGAVQPWGTTDRR